MLHDLIQELSQIQDYLRPDDALDSVQFSSIQGKSVNVMIFRLVVNPIYFEN
jgi:hypothetical protein